MLGALPHYLISVLALAIIAEHMFFFWDRDPSNHLIGLAIDLYKRSPNCNAVMKAVDEAFEEYQGHILMPDVSGQLKVTEGFGEKLVGIALDNRLCMFHPR